MRLIRGTPPVGEPEHQTIQSTTDCQHGMLLGQVLEETLLCGNALFCDPSLLDQWGLLKAHAGDVVRGEGLRSVKHLCVADAVRHALHARHQPQQRVVHFAAPHAETASGLERHRVPVATHIVLRAVVTGSDISAREIERLSGTFGAGSRL